MSLAYKITHNDFAFGLIIWPLGIRRAFLCKLSVVLSSLEKRFRVLFDSENLRTVSFKPLQLRHTLYVNKGCASVKHYNSSITD